MTAGQRKPEGQWIADERKAANLDQRLKSLIMSVLPNDQMNSFINCLTAKSTWDDLILYHEGPSNVKESSVMDLKLCYNTFKFKEDSKLASLFGKLKYEENLIDSISETEKNKFLVSTTPLSTAFFSTSIVQDFQDSPDDEEDTRSSHEYLNDLEEEYQARALLAKSKRFFKKGTQSSSASASKAATVKNKGLIAKAYEWNEEEVSSDNNEMVEVKVLMAQYEENDAVIKEGAKNGEWVKISMRKCISEQIPSQKKRILGADQLIEDPSSSGRILPAESQRNTTDPSVIITDSSMTDYDSADESSVCVIINESSSTPAKDNKSSSASKVNSAPAGKLKSVKIKDDPPLAIVMKELNNLKLQFSKNQSSYSRNTQPQQCKRTDHRTYDHAEYISTMNMIISLEREINLRNPQHAFKRCEACGSSTHTITDHYDIEWFKRGEAQQTKKAEALKSTRAEPSNAYRSKTSTRSGCSRHMTGVKSYLHKYVEQPRPKVVFGDDSTCTTEGYGSIKCNGIVFTKLAFVNGLKYNLISISQLCDAKYIVQFDEKRGIIFNSNKEVVMIAPRVRDVYVLDMTSSAQESCFFAKASDNLNWLWHKRLAHLNFKTINKLAKQNLVIGLSSLVYSKDKPCSSCEKGKHHKANFKTKQISSIKKCLHLLYMDLFGHVTPWSINHEKYTFVIVDEYSRYTWVYILKKKSQAPETIMSFIKRVKNQNDINVKQLITNNGTEFKNSILVKFSDEKGISQKISSLYIPEQNGVAERKNITLIEAARTMLSGSVFLKQYWTEAVATTCYTQNRSTIVKRHLKTPYEIFRKRIPNINFLHVFGCLVYIHNHKDQLGKFDEKADDGYLLRYLLVFKAFRVFNTRRQQTKETYHITFDESPDAIKFSRPSVDIINIAKNERYPSDEYLHPYEPSQRYQTNSNDVSFIEPYECPELTNEILNDDMSEHSNHTNDEQIIDNIPNTKDIQILEHFSSPDEEDTSVQNTIPIPNPSSSIPSMVTPSPQDRWS
ncbi:retrovirus-related pol polyprotein from transposon TNT 1-94 [Tanacetum coccineum]